MKVVKYAGLTLEPRSGCWIMVNFVVAVEVIGGGKVQKGRQDECFKEHKDGGPDQEYTTRLFRLLNYLQGFEA